MSDDNRPTSPDSFDGLFHHKSWTEPWTSPGFPPGETGFERSCRFERQPWWAKGDMQARFFKENCFSGWPWGYFIYRTVYGVSDADWNRAIERIDRYIYCGLHSWTNDADPESTRIVWEGYRNVIIDDRELLDSASVEQVRRLFKDWLERHHCHATPRFEYCWMIDYKALQSILASPEPELDDVAPPNISRFFWKRCHQVFLEKQERERLGIPPPLPHSPKGWIC